MILTNEQQQEHLLTVYERELLLRILSREFRGRNELVAQLQGAKVKWIDAGGSPVLLVRVVSDTPRAFVEHRTPLDTELVGTDTDGMPIRFILHVVNGALNEVEIFREDGGSIEELPRISELQHAYPQADY